jgi:hypothetical protein
MPSTEIAPRTSKIAEPWVLLFLDITEKPPEFFFEFFNLLVKLFLDGFYI